MLTLFLSVLALTCPSPIAQAERPGPPRTGNLEFGAQYSYFTTGANYDQNGRKAGIPNGGGLSVNQGTLTGAFDMGRRWRVFSSLNYNRASTTDGFFDRENGGLTDVGVGAQYYTVLSRFMLIPQLDGHFTIFTVDETSDQAAIGDGVNTVRPGGWAIWRLGALQPFAYLGAEYRDGGRSSLGHYSLGAHFKADAWWIEAQLRGFYSLTDDSDASLANRARRVAYLQRVNGGSLRFYAVNPAITELTLETGFVLDQFNIFAGGSLTVAGQSYAQGYGLWGGIRFTWPTRPRAGGSTGSLTGSTTDASGFEATQDNYDDTIFTDQPALGQKRVQSLRPRPRPKRPDPRLKQQDNLNRLLNETEQHLEDQ